MVKTCLILLVSPSESKFWVLWSLSPLCWPSTLDVTAERSVGTFVKLAYFENIDFITYWECSFLFCHTFFSHKLCFIVVLLRRRTSIRKFVWDRNSSSLTHQPAVSHLVGLLLQKLSFLGKYWRENAKFSDFLCSPSRLPALLCKKYAESASWLKSLTSWS